MSEELKLPIRFSYGIHAKHKHHPFCEEYELFANNHACAFVLPIDLDLMQELYTLINLYTDKPIIMLHYREINKLGAKKERSYICFKSFRIFDQYCKVQFQIRSPALLSN